MLAEPFNLFSNAAFWVAAGLLWKSHRRQRGSAPVTFLIVMIFLVGIGSSLYHSFHTPWAKLLDVLPIAFFLLAYLGIFLQRVLGFTRPMLLAGYALFGFVTLSFALLIPHESVNGSQNYFSALLALLYFGRCMAKKNKNFARHLYLGAGFLAAALVARSLDLLVCAVIPVGTHFIWHLCNSAVVYLIVRPLIIWPRLRAVL